MTAERAATGREDFEAFYRAHLAELVALAHALAGPDEAYDLAQETLLAASRRWRQVGELAQPDAWARDACAARATSGWRRRRRSLPGGAGSRDVVLDVPAGAEQFWVGVRLLPGPQARARTLGLFLDPGPGPGPRGRGRPPWRSCARRPRPRRRARSPGPAAPESPATAAHGRVRASAPRPSSWAATALLAAPAATAGRTTDPSTRRGPGAVVTNLGGTGNAGQVQVEGGSSTVLLTALPDGTPLVSPDDLEVSPEGDKLAVVGDDTLQVVGLGDDRTSTSVPCPRCRFVDWMGFKVGILLVTSYGVDGPTTHVYGNDGDEPRRHHDVRGHQPLRLLPDRLRMVGVQDLGRGDRQRSRLFVLDDTTGTRTPLPATTTEPGRFIYDVSWSPDGVQVGYIVAGEYDGGGVAAQDHRLMVASADGSDVHEVADLGRCYCVRTADPRFAWSPDGSVPGGRHRHHAGLAGPRARCGCCPWTAVSSSVLDGGAPVDWGPNAP